MGERAIVKLLSDAEYLRTRLMNVNGVLRIGMLSVPQHWALPAVWCTPGLDERQPVLDGVVALVKRPVEVTSAHYAYAEVRTFADHIRMALDAKRGTIAGLTVHQIAIDPNLGSEVEEESIAGQAHGTNDMAYLCTQTFDVWFDEQVA